MRQSREAKAETRQAVVAQAARLFRDRGIAGTSVGDVMAAAAKTHGGFYRHFEIEGGAAPRGARHGVRRAARASRRRLRPRRRGQFARALPRLLFVAAAGRQCRRRLPGRRARGRGAARRRRRAAGVRDRRAAADRDDRRDPRRARARSHGARGADLRARGRGADDRAGERSGHRGARPRRRALSPGRLNPAAASPQRRGLRLSALPRLLYHPRDPHRPPPPPRCHRRRSPRRVRRRCRGGALRLCHAGPAGCVQARRLCRAAAVDGSGQFRRGADQLQPRAAAVPLLRRDAAAPGPGVYLGRGQGFLPHGGIDFMGIVRAAWTNL